MGLSLNGATPWISSMQTPNATGASQPRLPNPEQAQIEQIQAQYGGQHGHLANPANPNQKAADLLAKLRTDSEAHIRGHEQAHQSAAGSLGGSMSIQYDHNGIAIAGQVPISIPPLDRNNPQASIKNYQTVRAAALAPGDPSGQDIAVAGKAAALMSQAQAVLGQTQVLLARQRQANSTNSACRPLYPIMPSGTGIPVY